MKISILIILLIGISKVGLSQRIDYNEENGFIANGYDVVSYFSNTPKKGNNTFKTTYDDANFRFSNQTNLDLFEANPLKYIPQYGGWCAYAVGSLNKKVSINPNTYEIRNGKLYLFYNSFFNNTLDSWTKENPDELILNGDKNWIQLKANK